jgi:hypothetical protein
MASPAVRAARRRSGALMQHALDIWLRLHIDEAEIRAGERPLDTAERLFRQILTTNDKVVDVQVSSLIWISRPITSF